MKTNLTEHRELKALFDVETVRLSRLRQAWREAEAHTKKAVDRQASGLPEENLEDPLRKEDRDPLVSQHKKTCSFDVPSRGMGTESLLGRFKREFERKNKVLFQVKGFKSMETATAVGPQVRKAVSYTHLTLPTICSV